METPSKEITQSERRYYHIDWLRVLAMFTIFLYHCARFFDLRFWHAKNSQLYLEMSVFVSFLGLWIIPLFFVLSGLSSYYSLGHRTGGQYIRARVRRLLIPLVFGTFTLIPPQVYFERVSHSQFTGSFIEFYPRYFDGFYAFGGNFAWMGLHLWYLEFLFIFSLMTLPLFLYLRRETIHSLIPKLASFFKRSGAIFLFAVPLIIVELLVNLQPDGFGRRDMGGWSIVIYPIFFIHGYLIGSDPQFKKTIEKHKVIALIMGVITSVLLLSAGYMPSFRRFLGSTGGYVLVGILRPFSSWCFLIAILGFGGKYLSFNNKVLKYANEAVLPFYILHQSVIVTIGFYIASWNASLLLKYLVISISSFVAIVILYELVVRRINLFRFLLGMKAKRKGLAEVK